MNKQQAVQGSVYTMVWVYSYHSVLEEIELFGNFETYIHSFAFDHLHIIMCWVVVAMKLVIWIAGMLWDDLIQPDVCVIKPSQRSTQHYVQEMESKA